MLHASQGAGLVGRSSFWGAQVNDDQLMIPPRFGGFSGELRFRDSGVLIP